MKYDIKSSSRRVAVEARHDSAVVAVSAIFYSSASGVESFSAALVSFPFAVAP